MEEGRQLARRLVHGKGLGLLQLLQLLLQLLQLLLSLLLLLNNIKLTMKRQGGGYGGGGWLVVIWLWLCLVVVQGEEDSSGHAGVLVLAGVMLLMSQAEGQHQR